MSKAKTTKKSNVLMLTVMAMLTAVIFLLGFTPIGYIKLGVIEITFLQIPVIIGALLYGWKAGALLGAMFGITSFIQCFGSSIFGAALLGINPFFTAFVCLVPRILMGFFAGLMAKPLIKHDKTKSYSFVIPSLAGALLNTLFFMSALMLCFWNTEYIQNMAGGMNVLKFCVAFVGINGLVEAVVCALLGTAIGRAMYAVQQKLEK